MTTAICYFSGTGNSFSVAKAIAGKTGGTLISIAEVCAGQRIRIGAESLGIVFPSYLAPLSGIPLIVERFIGKLEDIGSKRLFAVCSCGGYEIVNALPTLRNLKRLVEAAGGKLSAMHSVRLPMNNRDYDHIPVPIDKDERSILAAGDKKIEAVCRRILKNKPEAFRLPKAFFNFMMTPLFEMLAKSCLVSLKKYAQEPEDSTLGFRELIPLTDKSIGLDETCNGCGTCVKVCPVRNIVMIAGKPVWQHRCEMCFACDEWCPRDAIHHWSRARGVKYRHPGVKLKEMTMKVEG